MLRLILLCLLPTRLLADVVVEEFGVICDLASGPEEPAPGTESGVINLIEPDIPFDVFTQQVPAELGLSFGVRVWMEEGTEVNDLSVEVVHPPMGRLGVTHETWDTPLEAGGTDMNLFTFERPYEMVEGRWLFRIRDGAEILTEQAFHVLPKGSVPQVQAVCGAGMILS
ncbi:MAG: DUF3859 domain-containing protein [Pelagimonas sp.]|jgi:hypothetical protein|nr:DUF3859 domain-containing protein [Pelagimonas sp.]